MQEATAARGEAGRGRGQAPRGRPDADCTGLGSGATVAHPVPGCQALSSHMLTHTGTPLGPLAL